MEFYGRAQQIVHLQQYSTDALAGKSSMTLLVGRRRVGKTALVKEAYKKEKRFIYFFVSRKSEVLLVEEFVSTLKMHFDFPEWANLQSIKDVFHFIFEQSANNPITVVFDEFQDFNYVNPSVYSDLQDLWDTFKKTSKIHLILCGSIYSIMCKLFENSKEPLFGRADRKIHLKPLVPDSLRDILQSNKCYTPSNLLTLYTLTGGIPRYIELLHNSNAWDLNSILKVMLTEESFFIDEGKDVLIDEFGRDYKTYFSILALIASGKTSRAAVESVLQKTVGGYMEKLETEFDIITRCIPINAKPNTRNIKYEIKDNFINFWFKYFYKNKSALEIGNYNYVIDEILENFECYSGRYLEKMIKELLASSGKYNCIGGYWRSDNTNEIDVIAINDREKSVMICDVKLKNNKINLGALKVKSQDLESNFKGYSFSYEGYSLDNLPLDMRSS